MYIGLQSAGVLSRKICVFSLYAYDGLFHIEVARECENHDFDL